jgi:XTP/dITP diphosphohydrolase
MSVADPPLRTATEGCGKTLFIASSNIGKLSEFREIADIYHQPVELIPDFDSFTAPHESGSTFAENACIKASAYSRQLPGKLVVTDDSGLEVDALGGAPGIYSARYAADQTDSKPTDADNNYKLIAELSRRSDAVRTARFVCVIALACDGNIIGTFAGEARGEILQAPRGKRGFGYDPLFFVPAANKTFAEMLPDEKASCSHRAAAFRKLLESLSSRDPIS